METLKKTINLKTGEVNESTIEIDEREIKIQQEILNTKNKIDETKALMNRIFYRNQIDIFGEDLANIIFEKEQQLKEITNEKL